MTSSEQQRIDLQAFFALLQAGLWEKDARLFGYDKVDLAAIKRMAEEQSVEGVVAAGLDILRKKHQDICESEEAAMPFVFSTLSIEQRNKSMNVFIETLFLKMQQAGVSALLVKGQGVAQCYRKPQWRMSGDVDLFYSDDNYEKAKKLLTPLAKKVEPETIFKKHLGLTIDGWLVELHGSLRNGLSAKMDRALDDIQDDTFCGGKVRSCMIGETQVLLLDVENDVAYVFSHILDHFYKGGIGLRQICDWCRLLWTYKDSMDQELLESRVRQMGVMTEWQAFGAFAVDWLGMPSEAMPFFSPAPKWSKKALRIKDFVLEAGDFGRNRDTSYYNSKPLIIRKAMSLKQRLGDACHHARIFPLDSVRFLWGTIVTGVKAVASEGCKKAEG